MSLEVTGLTSWGLESEGVESWSDELPLIRPKPEPEPESRAEEAECRPVVPDGDAVCSLA